MTVGLIDARVDLAGGRRPGRALLGELLPADLEDRSASRPSNARRPTSSS
jgi:hypothetical protein